MIPDGHKTNFETFKRASKDGRIALMECFNKQLGETVTVLCMVSDGPDGSYDFVPFAQLYNGNPYEELLRPAPGGGFQGGLTW